MKTVLLELHVFKCDQWMIRRVWLRQWSWYEFGLRWIWNGSWIARFFDSRPFSASREGDGYHFRPRPPPTTRVEFLESDLKKDSRNQRSTAMQWSNISKEIDSLLKET